MAIQKNGLTLGQDIGLFLSSFFVWWATTFMAPIPILAVLENYLVLSNEAGLIPIMFLIMFVVGVFAARVFWKWNAARFRGKNQIIAKKEYEDAQRLANEQWQARMRQEEVEYKMRKRWEMEMAAEAQNLKEGK